MRKNRRKLPVEFTTKKTSSVGSRLFGFSDRQTLISYVQKKNKVVVLLSTMHSNNKIDADNGVPDMIPNYILLHIQTKSIKATSFLYY